MANQRGSGMSVTPVDFGSAVSRELPSSSVGVADRADETRSAVFGALGAKVGALADQLAGNEGRKAGLAAGTDPAFRPDGGFTIRAQAFDKAATDVYLSSLNAKFHSDALDIADRRRGDPAGLKSDFEALVADYRKNHVFPEIDGAFVESASRIGTAMRSAALTQFHQRTMDRQHATLIGNMSARERDGQRLLALDPHDPVAEQTLMRLRDEDVADIRSQVAAGAINAVQGEKLIIERQQDTQVKLAVARAGTLPGPAEVDAYRRQLKTAFGAGKLEGVVDWDGLDTALGRLAKQKGAEAERAQKALDGEIEDFLKRQQAGLDGSADWAALEARGKQLGGAGIAAVAAARDKLAIRRKIASLAPDEADLYVQRIEQAAKSAPPPVTIDEAGRKWSPFGDVQRSVAGAVRSAGLVGVVPPDGERHGIRSGSEAEWTAFMIKAAQAESQFAGDRVRVDEKFTEANGQISEGLFSASKTDLGNYPEVAAAIGLAGQKVFTQAQMDDPDLQARFAAGVFAQNIRRHGTIREGVGATQGPIARGEVDFSGPAPALPHGVSAGAAEVILDARKFAEERRKLVHTDPLAAAARDGLTPEIVPVDFGGAPDALAAAFRARVAQADAVAGVYRRPPAYIRPDEKPVLQARLEKGGQEAIDTVAGLVAGAGTRAPAVLKEIGDGAPELAHAAQVQLSTGDPTFGRQVAEAIAARAVKGARPVEVRGADVEAAWKTAAGSALEGLDATETARTRAAAIAWTEREMARRGIAPIEAQKVQELLGEGIQRARGRTGTGADAAGGVAVVRYGPPGWIKSHASSVAVQVPTAVKADRFGDVLAAITDADLSALPDPPRSTKGVATATDLRRLAPVFVPGGYAFVSIDATTGQQTPMTAASGRPFVLPFQALAPTLRARIPDAFR